MRRFPVIKKLTAAIVTLLVTNHPFASTSQDTAANSSNVLSNKKLLHERIQHIQTTAQQTQQIQTEKSGFRLAQWYNWNNWNNWRDWRDWNDWYNWYNY